MEKSKRLKILIAGAAIVASAIFGFMLWSLTLTSAGTEVRTYKRSPTRAAAQAAVTDGPRAAETIGVPERILIPSISVDAAIEQVALAKDGSLGVPARPLDAAWYAPGPRPGEAGNAVIDGHVDWWYGAKAVFGGLHTLKAGDTIMVRDDKGVDIPFVVRESRTYDAKADAADVFGSTDGKAHLNIITCDGKWDAEAKQYSKRLVVFADRREE